MNRPQPFHVHESDEPLDIRKDNIFKAVFTRNTPESAGALSGLVSAFIGRDITIVSIVANEPPPENIRDRQISYDINCRAENGELINVEMSFNPNVFEPIRLEFHTAKLFVGQNIRGSTKNFDDLRQTYQIAILAQKRFFPDKVFFHTFEYYDPIHNISLNGRTRIITLELTKLDEVIEKSTSEMSISERWAVFFEYLTDKSRRDKINEILENEEGIAMAGQVLMKVSRDEEERARILRDEKIELDYQSGMVTAQRIGFKEGREKGFEEGHKEGHEKGIEEGFEKGLEEIARNAMAKGYPVDDIIEITGLDLEIIKKLSEEE